jgi:hypothetical protein
MTGKYVFIGKTIGYPIPYATQFTNPQKFDQARLPGLNGNTHNYVEGVIGQADPNGLYSPPAADATWVMVIDPATNKPVVAYIEDKVDAFPFKLPPSYLMSVPAGY